ncbi:branched-chain amino acid ABC transporter substrate-binding protein [Caballeronia novacaledonica]|uniref:Branched-chain amino acid ABC transporter substrate-binding protein n=1 Tax=Caballeronia novacaledonica TaxID=1544861 RepID=A0ACB5R329_9BURK|nr:branched-chain amino acid ABC transporter substrate-binding protein [Caballeronia sp. EK]MBC8639703.1 branched-chain amino acid ABC transporter substrate-binding protein [Caballeronia sp. EK]GJH21612.1 branched-chain amino acid ABC transporter substrate-binding protein [Caballeronia novacaledonica]
MKPMKMAMACVASAAMLCNVAQAQQVVKIGVAGPLTGSAAQSGKDDERGVRLAIDELNAKGFTIAGKPVKFELISMDDQGDPKVGVNVAQKLVDDGVSAVIGHYNSGVSIPAARIYNDAHVVMMTGASSNPDLTHLGYPYVFRLATNDNVMGGRMAVYASKVLGAQRAAVIDDRTAYGTGVADVFIKTAQKEGLQIVAREYSTDKSTDFKAILTQIKSRNPQVVFYGGYYAQAATLARQMGELGVNATLVGGDGICSPEFDKLSAGVADKRMFCAQGGAPLDTLPDGKTFRAKFKSAFSADVDTYAPAFYAATLVVADAMQKAGSAKPEVFVKILRDQSFASILGPVKFDANGDWIDAPVTVYRLNGGALTAIAQKD